MQWFCIIDFISKYAIIIPRQNYSAIVYRHFRSPLKLKTLGQKQERRIDEILSNSETGGRISSGKIYACSYPILFSGGEIFCWGVKNNFQGQICFKGVGSTATTEDQPGHQFEKKLAHLMDVAGFNHSEKSILMRVFSFQLEKNLGEMKTPFCTMVRAFVEKTGTYPVQFLNSFKGERGVYNPNKPQKPDQFFYPVLNVVIPHGDDTKVSDIGDLCLLSHGSDLQRENFDPTVSDPDWRGIWTGKNLESIERNMTPSHIEPFNKALTLMKINFIELRDASTNEKTYEYHDVRVKALQKLLS